jgi:gamma-glutamylcyclotransferase (GGCT)/AIG2-like uncharacterized protein YtfP
VTECVFFYGTLMNGFEWRLRADVDHRLEPLGRGWIEAALFDLGPFPAAVPAAGSRVWGETCRMRDPASVLAVLDEIEEFDASDPETSLFTRRVVDVTLDAGVTRSAWVYFYNAPIEGAVPIDSGDYRECVTRRARPRA